MNHSQYHPISPPTPPSPTSRPNKVVLQRQYREKEGECFNILRDVIKDLVGEELQTRQEILRKAIDLLLAASAMRKSGQAQAQAVHPTPYGARPEDPGTSTHSGYSASRSPAWQSTAEFDAELASYVAQSHSQQHHLMTNAGTSVGMNQAGYPGEDWSGYGF